MTPRRLTGLLLVAGLLAGSPAFAASEWQSFHENQVKNQFARRNASNTEEKAGDTASSTTAGMREMQERAMWRQRTLALRSRGLRTNTSQSRQRTRQAPAKTPRGVGATALSQAWQRRVINRFGGVSPRTDVKLAPALQPPPRPIGRTPRGPSELRRLITAPH